MSQPGYYYRYVQWPGQEGIFGKVIEYGENASEADAAISAEGATLPKELCLGETLHGPFQEKAIAAADGNQSYQPNVA